MNIFRFASPEWFALLAPLMLLAAYDFFRRRKNRPVVVFSTLDELDGIAPTVASRLKKFMPALLWLGALSLVVALARPQSGVVSSRVIGEGISIMMCVDRSGSMAAEDFRLDGAPVSRLRAVKRVFRDFIAGSKDFSGRGNDLVGLIAFGGFVDSCCPLTLDHASLLELLDSIKTPIPIYDSRGNIIRTQVLDEESGTAIGDALAAAVDRLKDTPNKTKIIVLLSDGQQTAGALDPQEGIAVAQAYGVKVYTIAVGTKGRRVPFPQYLPNGEVRMIMENLDFDPGTLEEIALATGGRCFHAEDSGELRKVCEEIDSLERTKFDAGSHAVYRDLYGAFAILGMAALSLHALLSATRFRAFP